MPVGAGMGATQLAWSVLSVTLAAGRFWMITDVEPWITMPGPPGTQLGSMHGIVWLVIKAAGRFPISTVGAPGGTSMSGSAGCGTGVGIGAGGWIGA